MRKLFILAVSYLFFAFPAFSTCDCKTYINGYHVTIWYNAEDNDCGNPDAIVWSSGFASYFNGSKMVSIGADPGACFFSGFN